MQTSTRKFSFALKLLPWGIWLIAVGFLALLVGPILRDNDQASVLTGAWKIARGEASAWSTTFYNYDKQFLTYDFLALALKAIPGNPVTVANSVIFIAFWSAVAGMLWRYPIKRWEQLAAFAACLWAPVIWQHGAFFSGNLLSAALIFLGLAIWSPAVPGRKFLTVVLLGLAVGARADALLALPFCAWLLVPRQSWKKLLTNRLAWSIGAAGGIVLLFGRWIFAGTALDWAPFFFHPKVFAAFVVFGFGAAGLVFLWLAIRLLSVGIRAPARFRFFYLAGFAALLPPLLYYLLQLFTTLYFVAELTLLLAFVLSRRGRILLPANGFARIFGVTIALATLGPLLIGLRLNFVTQPQFLAGAGTPFPTADGRLTMGGYWPALIHQIRAKGIHDHNQPLWLAAKSVNYQTDFDERVPILDTPMAAYLELGATLQGKPFKRVTREAPWFYMDSRFLTRRMPAFGAGEVDLRSELAHRNIQWASAMIDGYGIVLVSPGEPGFEFRRNAILSRLFEGNEFRPVSLEDSLGRSVDGKTLVYLADHPFTIELRAKNEKPRILASKNFEGMHGLRISAGERQSGTLSLSKALGDSSVSAYSSDLVDYMSASLLAPPHSASAAGSH